MSGGNFSLFSTDMSSLTGLWSITLLTFYRYIVPSGTLVHRGVNFYRIVIANGTLVHHVVNFFYRYVVPNGTWGLWCITLLTFTDMSSLAGLWGITLLTFLPIYRP
jgi:hypothetical protein